MNLKNYTSTVPASTPNTMSLREAKTFNEVCRLQRDNWTGKHYWMLRDAGRGTIHIHKQTAGKPSEQQITIPVRVFNQMVDFYHKQQVLRKVRK